MTGRLEANGSTRLMRVNKAAQANRTRRAPSRPPRYTEKGPMNINDALNAVLIHEASSTPRCKAPLRSGKPTLIKRPVQVATLAPSNTPATPSKGGAVITDGEVCGFAGPGVAGGALKAANPPKERSCPRHEP